MICRKIWNPLFIGLLLVGCSKCPTLLEISSNRTVLAEIFSYSRCSNCPNAEEAIHRLVSEYGDSLAVLIYHMRILGDTLSPEDVQARAEWYGVGEKAPIAFFDGVERLTGAESEEAAYKNYKDIVVTRRMISSPIEMTIDAWFTTTDIQIDLEILPISPLFGNLKLWLVLFEDSVPFENSLYDFVVRWIEGVDFSLSGADTLQTTFKLQNQWGSGALGAVAFVQNDNTKEVLQARVKSQFRHGFELVCLDDTFQTIAADSEAVFRFTLETTGNLNDVYELSLTVVDSVQGWFEFYCYGGVCLLPPTVGMDTVYAGEIDTTISVHTNPMGQAGLEVVCFKVKSLGNTTLVDSVNLYTQTDGSLYLTASENVSFLDLMVEKGKIRAKTLNELK